MAGTCAAGFLLLEVLITIVLVGIGLLGLASCRHGPR
jgi:Tfp pilus assembly protein PilV